MAIAFDNANSVQGTGVANLTTSAWTIAGANRILAAGMGWANDPPPTYSSIKWGGSGGTALTQIGSTVASGSFHRVAAARLVAPAAASQTLYGELSGTAGELCLGGSSFTDVDQSAPLGTAATNSGTGSGTTFTATVNVSSAAGEVVFDVAYGGSTDGGAANLAVAVGASQTMRWEQENIASFSAGTQSTEAGAGTVTMSEDFTFGGFNNYAWGIIGVPLKVAVADTAALTGTVTGTIDEADIVSGGNTVILTLTGDTYVAASETTAITQPASANGGTTSTTSFSITLPTTQANDILILEFCHRGTGLGTIAGTSVSSGGLTWTHKHSQDFATSTFSGQMYWTRATGNHSGQTVTGASLTNACAAIVKVKRGCVESGDPFTNAATIVGEANASANETQAQITTLIDGAEVNLTILNSPDLAVATHACTSPGALGSEVEVLSTGGTDASISSACAVKATAGATGAFTWTQTDAAGGSYAYALEPKVTTPFADARDDMRDGGDSAQAEAGGWDAKVKPNIPLANIVRTSDTVCTITLQAQADYNITAQETITWTIPASILTGGAQIVASPTFTIDTDGGAPADPEGRLIGGKLIRGGLLRSGVLH